MCLYVYEESQRNYNLDLIKKQCIYRDIKVEANEKTKITPLNLTEGSYNINKQSNKNGYSK